MSIEPPKVPFKPKWKEIRCPSENAVMTGTPAQRLFSPVAGAHVNNPNSGESEVVLGGFENQSATIKIYQEEPDRYTRASLPEKAVSLESSNGKAQPVYYQGIGALPAGIIIAGGSPFNADSACVGRDASKRIFTFDAATKKSQQLPEMETPRAAPVVGSSPDGRYVVIAGGLNRVEDESSKLVLESLSSIEIFDRSTGSWMDIESTFPGLSKLPSPRFGGSCIWIRDDEIDRLFFIGGSSADANRFRGVEESPPTAEIDVYDFVTRRWLKAELPTPRMFPGVAARNLPDGTMDIPITGGGTGVTVAATRSADPQIYAVEILDPYTLNVSFGQHLPEQPAIRIGDGQAMEWSPTALVFATGYDKYKCTALKTSAMGYYFGFSKAFKGAPLDGVAAGPNPQPQGGSDPVPTSRVEQGPAPRTDTPPRIQVIPDHTAIWDGCSAAPTRRASRNPAPE